MKVRNPDSLMSNALHCKGDKNALVKKGTIFHLGQRRVRGPMFWSFHFVLKP